MAQEVTAIPVLLDEFNPELASKLTTITGILADLQTTIICLERLKSFPESTDQVTVDSCWATAIVMYARCFSNDRRRNDIKVALRNGVDTTTSKSHRRIIDLRNKYIAHSDNIFEQTQVQILLSPLEPPEIITIAAFSIRTDALNLETLEEFLKLAKTMHSRALNLRDKYSDEALVAVRKLPIQDVYHKAQAGVPRFALPTIEDVRKSRKSRR
jgi:hypothetical protein